MKVLHGFTVITGKICELNDGFSPKSPLQNLDPGPIWSAIAVPLWSRYGGSLDGRPPGSHGAMGPRFYLALGTFTLTENNLAAQGGDWAKNVPEIMVNLC